MRLRPRSIRVRLTLWHAAALALILAAFAGTVYLYLRAMLISQVAGRARHDLTVVENLVREYGRDTREIGEIEENGVVSLFVVGSASGALYESKAWRQAGLPTFADLDLAADDWVFETAEDHHYRMARGAAQLSDGSLAIAVAADEEPADRTLASLGLIMLAVAPLALGASVIGGYLLAGRVLRPVAAMAAAAERISAERLGDRLPVENPADEFGRMATVFNRTLARLQTAFDRLVRFTADASHELRTPLTAMRGVGEIALRDGLTPGQYRETIGSMLEEVGRLTHLTDQLLTLARADTEAYRATIEEVDLGALAREVAEVLRVLAEERKQSVAVEVDPATARVRADRTALRHALINLLDNAIKYTPAGGQITLVVRAAEDGNAVIEVRDTGPGIAREHRAEIFQRFYRVEQGRSRETGGAGLGLAIAKWGVEVSGGRIEVESEESRGSTFRIIFGKGATGRSEVGQSDRDS
jgi:heavy metal sensor kinase